jgi:hypothetical protein
VGLGDFLFLLCCFIIIIIPVMLGKFMVLWVNYQTTNLISENSDSEEGDAFFYTAMWMDD